MMTKKDGGPAFPSEQGETFDLTWNQTYDPGMSLRDYFAAKAMQAYSSLPDSFEKYSYYRIAEFAYKQADAMLTQRDQSDE